VRKNQVYTPNIVNDRDKLIATIAETAALPTIYVFKNINLGHTKICGVDVDLKARMSLQQYGKLNLSSIWSATTSYETADATGTRQWVGSYGYARWKGVTTLAWTGGPWYAGLTGNYRGSYRAFAQNAAGTIDIGAYSTLDLAVTYSGISKARIGGGIKNLAGKTPPFDLSSGIGQVWEDDASGRQIYANISYKF
jgi:iron complex outermembrane receptor protein